MLCAARGPRRAPSRNAESCRGADLKVRMNVVQGDGRLLGLRHTVSTEDEVRACYLTVRFCCSGHYILTKCMLCSSCLQEDST